MPRLIWNRSTCALWIVTVVVSTGCARSTQQVGTGGGAGGPSVSGDPATTFADGPDETGPDKPLAMVGAPAGDLPDLPLPPEADPAVNWEAWSIVHSPMHSAYDGVHQFQLPAHVVGVPIPPEAWRAYPPDAVSFSEWHDNYQEGVLITVERPEPRVVITAQMGGAGAYATLHISEGTPEEWELGQLRHARGVRTDFEALAGDSEWSARFPELLERLVFFPDGRLAYQIYPSQLELPSGLRCGGCHPPGRELMDVPHSPTRVARLSDRVLTRYFTRFGTIPDAQVPTTWEPMMALAHGWGISDGEARGLVLYLRSLPPQPMPSLLATTLDSTGDLPASCDPGSAVFDLDLCQDMLPAECRRDGPMFDLRTCVEALGIMVPEGFFDANL